MISPVRIWRRLRTLRHRDSMERSMDAEFAHHVECEIAARRAAGMSDTEARRTALRDFGGIERFKEEGRDARGVRLLEDLWADSFYALRVLRRNPGFTLASILTFALGIGAATAIFSVVNGVLLRPLPYRDPAQLVAIWESTTDRPTATNVVSVDHFEAWRERATSFSGMAALIPAPTTLTGLGTAEHLQAVQVTPGYFRVLGVPPRYGRDFTSAEEGADGAHAVIVSYGFWQRQLGADPGAVGRSLTLDGSPYTIVGVMPQSFLPPRFGWIDQQDIWLPFAPSPQNRGWGHVLHIVARLNLGVTPERATAELAAIAASFPQASPGDTKATGQAVSLARVITGDAGRPLLLLLGGVLLLLVMAVSNVAALTLSLARRHGQELLVRRAIGASFGRLVRQLLAQSGVIGAAGCAIGVGVAVAGMQLLLVTLPASIPRAEGITLDLSVLVPALITGALAAAVSGMAVAWRATRQGIAEVLAASAGRTTARAGRGVLVTAEMALATVLAILAALTVTSFAKLRHVDLGFDATGMIGGRISLAGPRYASDSIRTVFLDNFIDRVRHVPGVVAASLVNRRPLHGGAPTTHVTDPLHPLPAGVESPIVDIRFADSAYFETMRMPLASGRVFGAHAPIGPAAPIVINQAMAASLGLDAPVGRHVTVVLNGGIDGEIVGVVRDARLWNPRDPPRPTVYLARGSDIDYDVVVRGSGGAASLVDAVRRSLTEMDPSIPLSGGGSLQGELDAALSGDRFVALLLGGFALVGLLLAAVGIFGVFSSEVARARREIAVRIALGARAPVIVRRLLRRAATSAGIGITVGLVLAALGSRALAAQLYGIGPLNATVYGGVAVFLIVAALAATWLPAHRATRISPSLAMREE